VTEQNNPWLSRPTTPPPTIAATTDVSVARPTGPVSPQRGVPVPDQVDQLRVIEQARPAELWWVGAHGGSGESTLAGLVPEWPEAGHGWPRTATAEPSRVVLIARSNARGLKAAQAAIMHWASGQVPSVDVLGLVVVADAPGRLPRPLRDLAQVVKGGVPRAWDVPWIESWRLGEPPALADAPRDVRRLVDELRVILGTGAVGTTNWKEER
jgi:hypothetical protein